MNSRDIEARVDKIKREIVALHAELVAGEHFIFMEIPVIDVTLKPNGLEMTAVIGLGMAN